MSERAHKERNTKVRVTKTLAPVRLVAYPELWDRSLVGRAQGMPPRVLDFVCALGALEEPILCEDNG